MNHPHIRARLTTIALATVIIGAAIFALPRGDTQQAPVAPDHRTPTVDAAQDVGPSPGEWLIDRPDADPDTGPAASPEFADAAHSSTVEAGDMQQAADVATQFAVEFMSWHYDEASDQREARLSPLLTEHGRRWLAGGSSALAEVEDQRTRREVATAELAFLEPIDANSREIEFLVALRVTVSDTTGTETIEHSLTLTVQREDDGRWAVDEMHA